MNSNTSILADYLELVTYGFTNPMPDSDVGPWKVTAKDVIDGEINFFSARKTTQKAFNEDLTEKSRPKIGDVLLTKDGTLGRLAIVKHENICINQSVALLRPNGKILSEYLYYLLLTPEYQRRMIGDADGTVIKHIYITRVDKMRVDIPSLDIQEFRVKHLLMIDEKIKINRQINQTLEAMAQATFKSWFVDFDPVKAKIAAIEAGQDPLRAAMSAISGKNDVELDAMPSLQYDELAATAVLFPEELVESELGDVPKGWEVKPLDAIAEYLNGLALQKFPPKSPSDFLPVIKIAQLRAGHTANADRAASDLKPAYVVSDGDVLFSWSGSLEVEVWTGGRGALNQHLFKVTSSHVPKWFYYLATKHYLPQFREIAANKATTMGHIQRKHLSDAKVATPSAALFSEASKIFAPLLEKAILTRLQSRDLAQLRDTLLPKLLSGELSVAELEEAV